MSVNEYYDLRGEARLKNQSLAMGSESIPLELRSPYIQAETVIYGVPSRGSILDLCCGDGVHSIKPAQWGFSVTGVDLSEKSVAAAQWLAEAHQVKDQCQFFSSDALAFLESHPQNFDVIFISGSLYYFNLEEVLPRIEKALKPGGLFVCIGTNGSNILANIYRGIKQKLTGYRDSATMSRLLKSKDFATMQATFSRSHLQFFCFLSLLGKLFPVQWGLRQKAVQIFAGLDYYLFKIPGLWRLGFKYLLIAEARKPNE